MNEMKELIKEIEESVPTTMNHYGNYMALLSRFPKNQHKLIATMLIKIDALKLL